MGRQLETNGSNIHKEVISDDKTGHSGSNITSNITLFKIILLMWHIFNDERGDGGNLASYCNITHTKTI